MTVEQMGNCIIFLPNFDEDLQVMEGIAKKCNAFLNPETINKARNVAESPYYPGKKKLKLCITKGQILFKSICNMDIKDNEYASIYGWHMEDIFEQILKVQETINLVFPNNVVIKYKPKLQCKKK